MPSHAAHRQRPTLAPLPLRLVLGVTFIWAGWGKLEATIPVHGSDAQRLSAMGLLTPPTPPAPAPTTAPGAPLPSTHAEPATSAPAAEPPAQPARVIAPGSTAEAFPDPVPARRLWGVALKVSKAAQPDAPPPGAQAPVSTRPPSTLPGFLASSPWPKALAQLVLVIELVGGVFVLLGFLTRSSAASLAIVMLGAIWLDQLTPAIQAGTTVMGVLPAHDTFDIKAWTPLAWQAALCACATSLAIAGPGRLSIDLLRYAFAQAERRAAAPKPASGGRPA